jgi:hypothetical protein
VSNLTREAKQQHGKVPWDEPKKEGFFFGDSTTSETKASEWSPYIYLSGDDVSIDNVPVEANVAKFNWRDIPGLTGEVAQFIHRAAPRPLDEVAVAAAIAYLAGIVGRAYNVSGMGLNQYIALIAGTGLGKNAAKTGIDKLNNAVQAKLFSNVIPVRRGPSSLASAEGLIKHIVEFLCCTSTFGEVGFTFAEMTSRKANPTQKALKKVMLDLFTSSGGNTTFGGVSYSDKAKNVPTVVAPAWSFIGDATPSTFYGAFNEQSIHDGFLTRLLIIERELKTTVAENENGGLLLPPDELVTKIAILYRYVWGIEQAADNNKAYTWVDVPFDEESKQALKIIKKRIDAEVDKNNLGGCETVSEIHTRFAEKLLRLAALLAVGVNPYSPVITVTELTYAYNVVDHGTQQLIKRLQSGKLGEPNEHIEQYEQLMKCLKTYLAKEWNPKFEKNYGIPEHFKAKRLITYKYVHSMLHRQPAFRNANNPKMALESTLQTFEKAEHLIKIRLSDQKTRGKSLAEMWVICNLRE